MQDKQIVDLYWARSEDAIRQTEIKYGKMLYSVSYSVTNSSRDSEECVNDTYLQAWQRMPTDRPDMLGAYLSKIIRALSVDRVRHDTAAKRGGAGAVTEELSELIPSDFNMDEHMENEALIEALNGFIKSLDKQKRVVFVKRYFFCLDIDTICAETGLGKSAVKMILLRCRNDLGKKLREEGLL